MPYLKLIELATRNVTEVRDDVARLGRSPECTVVFSGERAGVVSSLHLEIRYGVAGWLLKDLASLNGTFLNGRRLTGEGLLKAGDVIGLGETGPRIVVAAVAESVPKRPESADRAPDPHAGRRMPASARSYGVTLLDPATGRRHEARGIRIRLGRGHECEVRLADSSDVIVSRVHAELAAGPSGALVVRDVGSRNGTFLNDERVTEPIPIRLGDRIMLGASGPVLVVEGLGTAPQLRAVPAPGALGRKSVMARIRAAVAKLLPPAGTDEYQSPGPVAPPRDKGGDA